VSFIDLKRFLHGTYGYLNLGFVRLAGSEPLQGKSGSSQSPDQPGSAVVALNFRN
jgi:hypothetical protein